MYNVKANNGVEFIIGFNNRENKSYVRQFDYVGHIGKDIKIGDFDDCYDFVQNKVAEINGQIL